MIPGNKVRIPGKETEWRREGSGERSIRVRVRVRERVREYEREERGERRAREERGKGRYIEGARDLRAAPFGGGIIIAQRVPAGVAFSTKVLHGRDHEADGSARVILVRRYTKTIFDAGRRVAIHDNPRRIKLQHGQRHATPAGPVRFQN
jgi:hypothetical protein